MGIGISMGFQFFNSYEFVFASHNKYLNFSKFVSF